MWRWVRLILREVVLVLLAVMVTAPILARWTRVRLRHVTASTWAAPDGQRCEGRRGIELTVGRMIQVDARWTEGNAQPFHRVRVVSSFRRGPAILVLPSTTAPRFPAAPVTDRSWSWMGLYFRDGASTMATEAWWTLSVPTWMVALMLSVWPASSVIALLVRKHREARQRHRRQCGLCVACGYDLRSTPERCPECGTLAAVALVYPRPLGALRVLCHGLVLVCAALWLLWGALIAILCGGMTADWETTWPRTLHWVMADLLWNSAVLVGATAVLVLLLISLGNVRQHRVSAISERQRREPARSGESPA